MYELALFAGAGGGILGGRLLGWFTVAACEIDPYCRRVLLQRQRDGALNAFPIWDDVQTLDGRPWRGCVDVITAGWPCQGFSAAGKGRGFDDERSGLWLEVARLIDEVRPRFVFLENSPRLISSGGLARCLSDLAALGYDAAWDTIGARHVGAPHRRDRCWILAGAPDAERPKVRKQQRRIGGQGGQGAPQFGEHGEIWKVADRMGRSRWWKAQSGVCRVDHDVAHRVDRLRAIGNGQVPQVAAFAFQALRARLDGRW